MAGNLHEARFHGLVEDRPQITSELLPLHEVTAGIALTFGGTDKMLEIVRPGTHDFRTHIQDVRRLLRRISDALAFPTAAINQDGRNAFASELSRNHRS